jgi:hypothetical protein
MSSSSGMSRLRFRDGRASKSRLRGQFDRSFISLNRARFALVPRRQGHKWDSRSLPFPPTLTSTVAHVLDDHFFPFDLIHDQIPANGETPIVGLAYGIPHHWIRRNPLRNVFDPVDKTAAAARLSAAAGASSVSTTWWRRLRKVSSTYGVAARLPGANWSATSFKADSRKLSSPTS